MHRAFSNLIHLSRIGDTLSQAVDFLPLLIQTVEKAAAQNTQHALLSEGVAAAVLLCRLSMLDSVSGELSSCTPNFPWHLILAHAVSCV